MHEMRIAYRVDERRREWLSLMAGACVRVVNCEQQVLSITHSWGWWSNVSDDASTNNCNESRAICHTVHDRQRQSILFQYFS